MFQFPGADDPENHVGMGRHNLVEAERKIARGLPDHAFVIEIDGAASPAREFGWQDCRKGFFSRDPRSKRNGGTDQDNSEGAGGF